VDDVVIGDRVRGSMNDLTSAERKVARVLLSAYPIAGLETLASFAGRADVSAPTVMRFVNKLGFSGYPTFQSALREEIQERMSSPLALFDRRPHDAPGGDALLTSAHETFASTLRSTFARLDGEEIDTAVRLLARRRRTVYTTGGRFSQMLAQYLYAHLQQLRPNVAHIADGLTPRHDRLIDLGVSEILVVFDYRRYQPDTIAFAEAAARQGTPILLFTDPWVSPIADVAEHVLISDVAAPSPYDSIVAATALVETVIVGLINELGEEAQDRIAAVERTREQFGWPQQQGENHAQ
jgi:DNA-binding MurR/RpiR family transcriptional regulator